MGTTHEAYQRICHCEQVLEANECQRMTSVSSAFTS